MEIVKGNKKILNVEEMMAADDIEYAEVEAFGGLVRIGSIDAGKDADFLIMEGHPFDYRVLPQMVFIDGTLVFRAEGKQLPF